VVYNKEAEGFVMNGSKTKEIIPFKYDMFFLLTIAVIVGFIFISSMWNPTVSGTKRWATYTGTVLVFEIDCSQCCHPSSGFSINTSDGIRGELIGDCDESLNGLIHVGQVYTIRVEPYAEPYASSRGSYWAVQIDWIKDSGGNVIYGSEWF